MNPIKSYLVKIGSKGGKSKSPAKAAAARINGAKPKSRWKNHKKTNQQQIDDL